jgi:hypothetical protein
LDMKKLLATTLLLAAFASPAFAWHHKAKTVKPHYNYKYKAPKSFKTHIHKQKQKHPHPA